MLLDRRKTFDGDFPVGERWRMMFWMFTIPVKRHGEDVLDLHDRRDIVRNA